jgi:hypothetical protein
MAAQRMNHFKRAIASALVWYRDVLPYRADVSFGGSPEVTVTFGANMLSLCAGA